jgi:hypothetical protein
MQTYVDTWTSYVRTLCEVASISLWRPTTIFGAVHPSNTTVQSSKPLLDNTNNKCGVVGRGAMATRHQHQPKRQTLALSGHERTWTTYVRPSGLRVIAQTGPTGSNHEQQMMKNFTLRTYPYAVRMTVSPFFRHVVEHVRLVR